ncbi:MAG: endolytic transglycosylase MltG [Inquilinus sp.]|nr:endolytic transglycosylase MltG [Inquilinus sp.]
MVPWLGRLFAALTALAVLAAIALFFFLRAFDQPGPLAEDIVLEIPRGAGLGAIADQFKDAGIVRNRWVFYAGVRLKGADRGLRAGEYHFPAAVSGAAALDILTNGRAVAYSITIPEGLTSHEIVELISAAPDLVGEIDEVPPQGSLLPETYLFTRGDTRADIIARMQAAMIEAVERLWAERAEGLPFDTPEQAVILASIIEKETGVNSERAVVAGVFINRLRRGMRLQTDPTVIYALTNGERPLGRELWRRDLTVDSPYNTYKVVGLPPGPIANPGLPALEAAMNPAETEYLYFVADGSGGHAFAKTLRDHNRNVTEWRRFQRQNGSN